MAFDIWVGNRLTARPRQSYARNDVAIAALSISTREIEVLDLLAARHANKVIARLFEKLDVASRTQAISRARELEILP